MFRVTISWLFYQIRKRKQGHLGLNNSLSLHAYAPHERECQLADNHYGIICDDAGDACGSYSLYYSTEKETRYLMPFDFMFEDESSDGF